MNIESPVKDGTPVSFALGEDYPELRDAVRRICAKYPGEYWRGLEDRSEYPTAFVNDLTAGGYLAALIPPEYGGAGLPIRAAAAILEEINIGGCTATQCHAQMYIMGTVLRHGSEAQKQRYLPGIAKGELRLQAFGVTEPTTGSDTTKLKTRAVRKGNDRYVVNGQKVWTSRALHSDLMLLLARTTPYAELKDKTQGLSVFLLDMRDIKGKLDVQPLDMMFNHHTNILFFENVEIPAENRIGDEGKGFRYIIDGWNAERILIASEAIGDGRWFVERGAKYASERVVFGKPIGANQGVQFPLARSYAHVEAAAAVRDVAAEKFDRGEKCGAEANMAKLLSSEAAWEAANACLDAFGGYGFAREYDVERKFRETRLYMTAPINNNLVLAFLGQNVLGMPKSY
jgi:acyl-CoA dehydrogenase